MDTLRIYNHEIEQALLAFIIRNPDKYNRLADITKAENFHWQPFRWAWEAANRLDQKGMKIDGLTLGDEMERESKLTEFQLPELKMFTGRVALGQLRDIETTEAGETYAMTIHDYSAKRQILEWLNKGAEWCMNGRVAADIITDLEQSFSTLVLHNGKSRSHTHTMDIATVNAIEAAEAASRGERAAITGLPDLDKMLSPQKTELIVIAARPGQGKSSLLNKIAIENAQAGKKVKLFTTESGATTVTQRLISQLSGVSAFKFMRGTLTPEEWEKIHEGVTRLQELSITICDLPEIKIGQIRTECRREPIDVAILDYIQLANSDKKNDRRDLDIGEVTRGCLGLAKELDIPFFAAAQVGRQAEGREPTLADLRESGSIEADARSVVFIHRNPDSCELIVAKHNNGPVGKVPAYFHEETMMFSAGAYKNFTPNEDIDR